MVIKGLPRERSGVITGLGWRAGPDYNLHLSWKRSRKEKKRKKERKKECERKKKNTEMKKAVINTHTHTHTLFHSPTLFLGQIHFFSICVPTHKHHCLHPVLCDNTEKQLIVHLHHRHGSRAHIQGDGTHASLHRYYPSEGQYNGSSSIIAPQAVISSQ